MKMVADMKTVAEEIPGYTYGTAATAISPISLDELEQLKRSVAFTKEDEDYLRMAGEVLADQTKKLVDRWRGVIAETPNLAKHSRGPDGKPIAHYSENSGLRFQQWILDTCFRPYDREWLNYQQEIALRHTSLKKNKMDGVQSTRTSRFAMSLRSLRLLTIRSSRSWPQKDTVPQSSIKCTAHGASRCSCKQRSGPNPMLIASWRPTSGNDMWILANQFNERR